MRFRVEYLSETSDQRSVCQTLRCQAEHLEAAAREAEVGLSTVASIIAGYQIRDTDGQIVLQRELRQQDQRRA